MAFWGKNKEMVSEDEKETEDNELATGILQDFSKANQPLGYRPATIFLSTAGTTKGKQNKDGGVAGEGEHAESSPKNEERQGGPEMPLLRRVTG
ncbi:hypothetical protein WH47_09549 [Habropoda laboriosa]|uniref:Uncharacterized protein n=1 Tax=Habropoda laboriosa TaxID=597456 RepID=A0A0L7RDE0_9HYME|nr:hypothetical protein WH47_09549 [Habropoda laboriosa]